MPVPTGFDPITLNHWLWFKYRCHEASPTEFQSLFENIVKRAKPEFMQIRPYGNIGDRKCDGLYYVEQNSTVFQVYSPDELKLAELQRKINEDFDGAYQHWNKMMRRWVFVYNARRGLPPDIPKILESKRKQAPAVAIDHWSSDHLWELARGLSLQQRSEILGAPNGYENLFLYGASSREIEEQLSNSFLVLVQDLLSPMNLQSVVEALSPAKPFGAPFFIRPVYGDLPWEEAAREQRLMVLEAVSRGRDVLPRFAVFALAPIPLLIHLGFVLSDRVEVQCFQYDRDTATWKWPAEAIEESDGQLTVSGLPVGTNEAPMEVSIALSLSARILPADIVTAAPASRVLVEIGTRTPDVMWLKSPKQLAKLGKVFRATLARLRSELPQCSRIHLFYAGPAGGAVVVGQQINPRMNPPIELYEYSRQKQPHYRRALTLLEELS